MAPSTNPTSGGVGGSDGDENSAGLSTSETTWLTLAADEIRRKDLSSELLEVLRAFGGDDAPGPATLDPDDDECHDASNGDDATLSAATATTSTPRLIASELVSEVDPDQAELFGRRFASVSRLLLSRSGSADGPPGKSESSLAATARLLRLALHRRARQILLVPDKRNRPRALRVRALVDFVWSRASLPDDGGDAEDCRPTLAELVARPGALRYDELAPGVRHAVLEGATSDFGPVHVNVLRVRAGAADMRCVDARHIPIDGNDNDDDNDNNKPLGPHGPCTDLTELAAKFGAIAAISGGFFLYSEPDIAPPSVRTDPVGLLAARGRVISPPVFRRAALYQTKHGGFGVARIGMDGCNVRIVCERRAGGARPAGSGGDAECTAAANGGSSRTYPELVVGEGGVRCVHRGDSETVALTIDEVGISIVGTRVVEYAADADRSVDVPLAGFVLVMPSSLLRAKTSPDDDGCSATSALSVVVPEGSEVEYRLPASSSADECSPMLEAMAGGPMLLSTEGGDNAALDLPAEDFRGSAPPVTFSQDETFDRNLLPRMAAGLTAGTPGDGENCGEELVCAAIDGRNLDRALGLTLRGTAGLLSALGCVTALNLDGGSSKRMVVRRKDGGGHEVVCLSTTEIRESSVSAMTTSTTRSAADKGAKPTTQEMSRPVHSAILFLPPRGESSG